MINIGILGSGNHSQENLLPALQLVDQINIQSVHSRDKVRAGEISKMYDIPSQSINEDPTTFLDNTECDAFVVSATPHVHQELLKAAIKQNRHIFVEKPPVTNLDEMKKVYDLIKEHDKPPVVQFGFNFRHASFYQDIVDMNKSSGSIRYMKIKSYASKPDAAMWDYEGIVESSLYAAHIHAIEMVCYTLGNLLDSSHSLVWIDDYKFILTITAHFEDGKVGVIEMSNVSNRFEFNVECVDSRQNVINVNGFNHVEVHGPDYDSQGIFKPKSVISYDIPFLRGGFERTGYSRQFEFFRDSIMAESFDNRSLESCVDSYRIIDEVKNEK